MPVVISPYALVDLATIKSLLNIPPAASATEDPKLTLYINAATKWIESYCDRIFAKRSGITDILDGRGSNKLLLHQFPVISVQSLYISSERNFSSADNLIDPGGYAVVDEGSTVLLYDQSVPNGYGNVQVNYTAGYDTVPDDLLLACSWVVEWYYRLNKNQDIGRTSRGKGDENTQILQSMPQLVLDNIMNYKRLEFPNLDSPVRNR